jgi:hypothetical protein
MPRWPENKTAADVLADVGRILYGSDDWQARLARDLKIGRHTIQQWRSGKLPLGPDHGALDDLLALAERRADEVARARDELREWLARNRGTAIGT